MNETKVIETTNHAEISANEESAVEKKPYEFRRLGSEDVFLMFNIIGKIGIREFKACFQDDTVGKLISKLFGDDKEKSNNAAIYTVAGVTLLPIVDIIIGNLDKCKEDIYSLLANVTGWKAKDIKELDAVVFVEMIVDFVKKPEFPDFIKVVSRLFK